MASEQADHNPKIKLKLLIDSKSQKVLLAEAGKEAVDFLFSLLALPVGSLIKLVTKESMVGSLGCTYGSLEQLDNGYFLSEESKRNILESKAALKKCPYCRTPMDRNSDFYGFPCKTCSEYTLRSKGYVIGGVTFSVMDDLSVVPMTPTSTIALLQQLGLNDFSLLEERTVYMQYQEGLELLKTSLWSKNVLTEVFLANNKKVRKSEAM